MDRRDYPANLPAELVCDWIWPIALAVWLAIAYVKFIQRLKKRFEH